MISDKRRSLLTLAGIAPAAAAGLAISPPAQGARAPAALVRSTFAPHVGEEFTFEMDALTTRRARLVKVEPLRHARDPEASFRLVFRWAEPGQPLAAQTYRVAHPAIGRSAIYLSPGDAEGRVAEALFNRL